MGVSEGLIKTLSDLVLPEKIYTVDNVTVQVEFFGIRNNKYKVRVYLDVETESPWCVLHATYIKDKHGDVYIGAVGVYRPGEWEQKLIL